jgi:hypothetical protein
LWIEECVSQNDMGLSTQRQRLLAKAGVWRSLRIRVLAAFSLVLGTIEANH